LDEAAKVEIGDIESATGLLQVTGKGGVTGNGRRLSNDKCKSAPSFAGSQRRFQIARLPT
jgi:hypothetical protein